MPDDGLAQILEIIARLSPGASPNEGFEVRSPIWGDNRLGMSEDSRQTGSALNLLQGQGAKPPMPAGSGFSAKGDLFKLIRLLGEIGLGEGWPSTQQDVGQKRVQDAGLTDGTFGGSRDLLRTLLK